MLNIKTTNSKTFAADWASAFIWFKWEEADLNQKEFERCWLKVGDCCLCFLFFFFLSFSPFFPLTSFFTNSASFFLPSPLQLHANGILHFVEAKQLALLFVRSVLRGCQLLPECLRVHGRGKRIESGRVSICSISRVIYFLHSLFFFFFFFLFFLFYFFFSFHLFFCFSLLVCSPSIRCPIFAVESRARQRICAKSPAACIARLLAQGVLFPWWGVWKDEECCKKGGAKVFFYNNNNNKKKTDKHSNIAEQQKKPEVQWAKQTKQHNKKNKNEKIACEAHTCTFAFPWACRSSDTSEFFCSRSSSTLSLQLRW